MALFYPDRLQSNNPAAYGIVKGTEVSGYKQVAAVEDLYALADAILSENGTGSDAVGQVWFVQSEGVEYRLISWENRATAAGWQKDQTTENLAEAKTEVTVKTEGHVKVAKTTGSDGQDVYTITEDDIASAELLGTADDTKDDATAFGKIAAETERAKAAEKANKDAIDLLNDDDTKEGSVAHAVKVAKEDVEGQLADAIADMKLDEVSETGKAIIKVSQTGGVVSAELGDIAAAHVTFDKTGATGAGESVSTVQAALIEVYGKIDSNKTAGVVKVFEGENEVSEIKADGKTYTIKQGTTAVATINIAKDMVVSGGTVITADGNELKNATEAAGLTAGEKYIKLTLANSADILFIPVNELYKDHTGSEGTKIVVSISDANVISATIVAGSIEKTDLVESLQTEISNATSNLTTIKGDGEGSINKALQDAKDYSDDKQRFVEGGDGLKNAKMKDTNVNANNEGELAIGKYNVSSAGANAENKTAFSIGNGTSGAASNAFEVRENGDLWVNYGSNYSKLQTILSNEIDWYVGD